VLGLNIDQCSLAVIRDENYKYVHFDALPPLFFDLEKDPHELHNAYNDHEYIEVIKKMKSEIIHQRNLLGDIDKDNVEIHEIISNHWN
jgi:arylsulfatase A-like enzyme